MKQVQFLGVLSLLGGVTVVPLIIAFATIEWGAPGTAVYARYELLNRLMAVVLLFMAAGWVGLWRLLVGYGRWAALLALIGTVVVAGGTAAEFWLFTDLPYAGENLRHTAFAAVSMGGLVLDMAAMIVGTSVWRSRIWPRWSAVGLMLALPIDFAAFFWINAIFATPTVLALLIGFQLLRQNQFPG